MSCSSGFEMSQSRPNQVLGLGRGHGYTCCDDHDEHARSRPAQDDPGRGGSDAARRSGAWRLGMSRRQLERLVDR